MRIAVIGAGIVGVTTAYELAADGHEVTVFDRCNTVAAESSFANAGFIAPGYAAPWAVPGMRSQALRQMFTRNALRGGPSAMLEQWHWIARWWMACRPEVYARSRRALFELARYSQQRLRELRRQLGLEYERGDGVLVLLRTDKDLARARGTVEALRALGVKVNELSAEQCREMEPDLSLAEPLAAVLQLPDDETGNCRQVAHLLRELAETRHNVRFRFGTNITRLDTEAGRPRLHTEPVVVHNEFSTTPPGGKRGRTGAAAAPPPTPAQSAGAEVFDAAVVCAGVDSATLLQVLGLHIPVLPVHGYSATFALRVKELGPRSAMMDEHYKVAITRLGPRVRVAGCAEVGGHPRKMSQPALETLYKVLQDWFPGAAQLAVPQLWKGARPMLPDGPPVIGASGIANVWLNLGHGSSGWALACGSARMVADQVAQRTGGLDAAPFSVERYS
jgi:D-amino-acid dehydrogenase